MKTKTSLVKKSASVVAGGALLAALYANAVLVPQNQNVAVQDINAQVSAVIAGEAEFVADADGFQVVEVAPQQKSEVRQLAAEIKRLKAEIEKQEAQAPTVAVASESGEPVRAAYQAEEVERTAQASDPFAQLTAAAAQISSISGLPIGATIGSLASISADPLLAAGAVEVINASTQPGGISQAITVGGGLSSQAVAVLTLLGVQNVGGIGTGSAAANAAGLVGAAGTTGTGSSTGSAISV